MSGFSHAPERITCTRLFLATIERIEYEGVEGIRVGRFNVGVNTTAIVYRVGSTVIDTGPPNQWPQVRAFLNEKTIDRILLTHHHEDHSGNGARIQREFGVQVLAPQKSLQLIAEGFKLRRYQRVVWGTPERFRPEPLPEEIEMGQGTRLRVLPAPGHAVDHVCLLEPGRRWLFSGDLFVGARTRYFRSDENVHPYIASLRRTAEQDLRVMFCGHRGVVESPCDALRAKCEHMVHIRDEARRLDAQGVSRAQITRRLMGREDAMRWITSGHFAKGNLIASCLAPEE